MYIAQYYLLPLTRITRLENTSCDILCFYTRHTTTIYTVVTIVNKEKKESKNIYNRLLSLG